MERPLSPAKADCHSALSPAIDGSDATMNANVASTSAQPTSRSLRSDGTDFRPASPVGSSFGAHWGRGLKTGLQPACWAFTAVTFAMGMVSQAAEFVIPVDWWTHRTESSNVIEVRAGGVRLGAARTGYVEGTVVLPEARAWIVRFAVNADESGSRARNDTVRVLLDGTLVGEYPNDPASAGFRVSHAFHGSRLDYRFEFASANATTSLHQVVSAGVAMDSMMVRVAGGIDGFGTPPDPAQMSPHLAELLLGAYSTRPTLHFDQVPGVGGFPANCPLGTSFSGIPPDTVEAVLWVRLRGGETEPDTDTVSILFASEERRSLEAAVAWRRALGPTGSDPGLLQTRPWTRDDEALVRLPLASLPLADGGTTNLMGLVREFGFMDVMVEDDSGVDFMILEIHRGEFQTFELRASSALELEVSTQLGRLYQIEASQDMGMWTDFGAPFIGDGLAVHRLVSQRDTPYRFFRVAERQAPPTRPHRPIER